jgi:thiamine biosynthesis lipoprotein
MADILADWAIATACLQGGGSSALALDAPPGAPGWPVGLGEAATHRQLALTRAALSGSGVAVKGAHLIDPRTGAPSNRSTRAWCLAPSAALSDALSTAFFLFTEAEVAAFCLAYPEIGAASATPDDRLSVHGALRAFVPA